MDRIKSIRVGRIEVQLGATLSPDGISVAISPPNGAATPLNQFSLNNVGEVQNMIYALQWVAQQMSKGGR